MVETGLLVIILLVAMASLLIGAIYLAEHRVGNRSLCAQQAGITLLVTAFLSGVIGLVVIITHAKGLGDFTLVSLGAAAGCGVLLLASAIRITGWLYDETRWYHGSSLTRFAFDVLIGRRAKWEAYGPEISDVAVVRRLAQMSVVQLAVAAALTLLFWLR